MANITILQALRSCSFCGSFWGLTDVLCEVCWERLERAVLQERNQILASHRYVVRALFLWQHRDQELIKNVLYALKEGWSLEVFQKLAGMIATPFPKDAILVPAPGRNHAKAWAKAVGDSFGLEIFDILVPTDFEKQKRKSKTQRHNIQMTANVSLGKESRRVIFMDDVITTGATATAAYRALGEPKKFEVCCIVCNPIAAFVAKNLGHVL